MDCVCTAQNIGNCFEMITITGRRATILFYLPDTSLLQPMPTAARRLETKSHYYWIGWYADKEVITILGSANSSVVRASDS